jgi:CheY-like chemotaxis protein
MRMPGMQGAEVIREFRLINADIRIVAMSGYFTRQMDLTVNTERLIFLQKPMTGLELQSALQRVIRVPAP